MQLSAQTKRQSYMHISFFAMSNSPTYISMSVRILWEHHMNIIVSTKTILPKLEIYGQLIKLSISQKIVAFT